jgi:hypothetical protein
MSKSWIGEENLIFFEKFAAARWFSFVLTSMLVEHSPAWDMGSLAPYQPCSVAELPTAFNIRSVALGFI